MSIPGRATAEGTLRYQERLGDKCHQQHYRKAGDLVVSSMGLGTYLGDPDDHTDAAVTAAVIECAKNGINFIDSAINYRFQRGEQSIGASLKRIIGEDIASRDELIVCTKGGFLPEPSNAVDWFTAEYVDNPDIDVSEDDLVAGCHCLHPAYLRDQLDRSLVNLGVETIDVYYLHNPETQLSEATPDAFWERIKQAFTELEAACAEGKLASYGVATWNAFRVLPHEPDHLNLADLKAIALEAAGGGEDHLRFAQLPFNLAMPEALLGTQEIEGEAMPVIEAAMRLGVHLVASASICQAQVLGKISPKLAETLGQGLTDAQKALQFTRSAPGFTSALVGMKHPDHVKENLALTAIKPMDATTFISALTPT